MEPLALAQLFVLPAVLAAGWALVAARWGGDAAARARWVWPGVVVALLIANPATFTAVARWPWVIPAAMVASLAILLLAPLLRTGTWSWPKRLPVEFLILTAAFLPTFPWWTRGAAGWGILLLLVLAALTLAQGARIAIAGDRWRGIWLWGVLLAVGPVAVLAMANASQAMALGSLALAIGAAALAGLLRGGDLLAGRADLLPAGALVLLIGNARLRYVPGPSEAAWEGWLLLLGPVLLLLAPWLWALIARRGAVRLGAVAAGILAVIGVALAMSAYIYEGAAADQSGPSWDYGSIGVS